MALLLSARVNNVKEVKFDKVSTCSSQKWGFQSVNKIFLKFELVTYFLTGHDPVLIFLKFELVT